MKKRKSKFVITGVLLAGLLISSPYSLKLNLGNAAQPSVTSSHKEKLFFYSKSDMNPTLDFVKNSNKDESLKDEKEKFKNGSLTVDTKQIGNPENLEAVTALAYPADEIKQDAILKDQLQKALRSGKRIYLYGGVTFNDYRELLGVEEVSVMAKDSHGNEKKVVFGNRDAEIAQEKSGIKKKNPNQLLTEKEDNYDIIGFTLDPNTPHKLSAISISVNTANGKTQPSEEHYLREVLDNLSYIIDKSNQQENKPVSLIKKNAALAGSNIIRATSPYRFEGVVYWYSELAGKTFTSWDLLQNADETVANYDYFIIKDYTTIQPYNGWGAYKLKADHDIPWDADYILEWGPGDSNSSPYNISLSWPFGAQWSFSMSTSPTVDEMGSQPYDYGRWEVYNSLWYIDGEKFQPATTWKSYGTWADMDIREFGTFISSKGQVGSSIKIDVSWDY